MGHNLSPRERVLNQLMGKPVDRPPCYNGMGNVTTAGIDQLGYRFAELHEDAAKMAAAAATSYKLFGYECAVVPFDFCVEAEALGCTMNTYEDVNHLLYPTIKEKAIHGQPDPAAIAIPEDLVKRGRVPVVAEAIRLLKADIGAEVAIGSYLLGPITLLGQMMDLDKLFRLCFKEPDLVNSILDKLTQVTVTLARHYREAGVDYVCIREMGATTDVLSPKIFRKVIMPHLHKIFAAIDYPAILHICGGTNTVVDQMAGAGASAIAVEKKNDVVKTRETIGSEPLVFGNLDTYDLLVNKKPEDVQQAVLESLDSGVDAVWSGCDIWPTASIENLKAMVDTVRQYGAEKWRRQRG